MESIRRACGVPADYIRCGIDDAEARILIKEQRRKRPFPWKVDLDFGPDLTIPTTGLPFPVILGNIFLNNSKNIKNRFPFPAIFVVSLQKIANFKNQFE